MDYVISVFVFCSTNTLPLICLRSALPHLLSSLTGFTLQTSLALMMFAAEAHFSDIASIGKTPFMIVFPQFLSCCHAPALHQPPDCVSRLIPLPVPPRPQPVQALYASGPLDSSGAPNYHDPSTPGYVNDFYSITLDRPPALNCVPLLPDSAVTTNTSTAPGPIAPAPGKPGTRVCFGLLWRCLPTCTRNCSE